MKHRVAKHMCLDKIRYNDERAAQREVTFQARVGFNMKAYRCKRCGALHLASVKEGEVPA